MRDKTAKDLDEQYLKTKLKGWLIEPTQAQIESYQERVSILVHDAGYDEQKAREKALDMVIGEGNV